MQILQGLDGLRQLPAGAVVSVGNFDGIHRGHQEILRLARDLAARAAAALAVVTFEPHPLTVLRPGDAPPRLTPPGLKQSLLAEAGAGALVVLPPTPEVLDLSAEQFWAILRDQVRPSHLVEGGSFTFGKNRGGTVERLGDWSAAAGVRLHVAPAVRAALTDMHVVPVSSSLVRWLLARGRVRDAAICLGRGYVLEGPVVQGHQRGRTLGVPTANLRCDDQLVPADGVYAGRCAVEGRTWPAAVSIGTMPTFGANDRQVEAHLVGFAGDLYGRTVRLELVDWVREQWKFPSVAALKERLGRDISEARARAGQDSSRGAARVG